MFFPSCRNVTTELSLLFTLCYHYIDAVGTHKKRRFEMKLWIGVFVEWSTHWIGCVKLEGSWRRNARGCEYSVRGMNVCEGETKKTVNTQTPNVLQNSVVSHFTQYSVSMLTMQFIFVVHYYSAVIMLEAIGHKNQYCSISGVFPIIVCGLL